MIVYPISNYLHETKKQSLIFQGLLGLFCFMPHFTLLGVIKLTSIQPQFQTRIGKWHTISEYPSTSK